MLIALDYDGTYTEDPDFWNHVIEYANTKGHRVWVVTMRHEDTEGFPVKAHLEFRVDKIIFTERKAKMEYVTSTTGERPDVWIDDNPAWLFENSL